MQTDMWWISGCLEVGEGKITKGSKETWAMDVRYLDHANGFLGVYVKTCQPF